MAATPATALQPGDVISLQNMGGGRAPGFNEYEVHAVSTSAKWVTLTVRTPSDLVNRRTGQPLRLPSLPRTRRLPVSGFGSAVTVIRHIDR